MTERVVNHLRRSFGSSSAKQYVRAPLQSPSSRRDLLWLNQLNFLKMGKYGINIRTGCLLSLLVNQKWCECIGVMSWQWECRGSVRKSIWVASTEQVVQSCFKCLFYLINMNIWAQNATLNKRLLYINYVQTTPKLPTHLSRSVVSNLGVSNWFPFGKQSII